MQPKRNRSATSVHESQNLTAPGSYVHFAADLPVQLKEGQVIQRMSELDTETRKTAREEVEAGRHHAAALWIFYKYQFNSKYPNAKVVKPKSNLKHHETNESVFAATGGELKKDAKQEITFNKEKFEKLVLSKDDSDWAYLVSAMGHECEHSAQRSGTDKRSGNRVIDFTDEAEFLSYSWEALGLSPGPPLNDKQLMDKANTAITHWNALATALNKNKVQLSDKLKIPYTQIVKDCDQVRKSITKKRKKAEELERKRKIMEQTKKEIEMGIRYKNGKLKSYGTFK